MWTALIGTIGGLLSGSLHKLLQEFTNTREHNREKEFLTLQTDLRFRLHVDAGTNEARFNDASVVKLGDNKAAAVTIYGMAGTRYIAGNGISATMGDLVALLSASATAQGTLT